jgi:hypothetical protein
MPISFSMIVLGSHHLAIREKTLATFGCDYLEQYSFRFCRLRIASCCARSQESAIFL